MTKSGSIFSRNCYRRCTPILGRIVELAVVDNAELLLREVGLAYVNHHLAIGVSQCRLRRGHERRVCGALEQNLTRTEQRSILGRSRYIAGAATVAISREAPHKAECRLLATLLLDKPHAVVESAALEVLLERQVVRLAHDDARRHCARTLAYRVLCTESVVDPKSVIRK